MALSGCGGDDGEAAGGSRVATLALDFQPNAAHAGIYAQREGLDSREGLDLRVRVPAASTDSLKLLAAGRADMSVVDIHDLGLSREAGSDVVGAGALVQRPLAAVIARAGVGITRPRDLEGRRVGVTGLPSDDAVLRAIVESDGGSLDRVERVTIGFSAVPSLIAGRVDAVVSFWNAEGWSCASAGAHAASSAWTSSGRRATPSWCWIVERRRCGSGASSSTRCSRPSRPAPALRWPTATARWRTSRASEPTSHSCGHSSTRSPPRCARHSCSTARARGLGRVRRPLRHPAPAAGRGGGVRAAGAVILRAASISAAWGQPRPASIDLRELHRLARHPRAWHDPLEAGLLSPGGARPARRGCRSRGAARRPRPRTVRCARRDRRSGPPRAAPPRPPARPARGRPPAGRPAASIRTAGPDTGARSAPRPAYSRAPAAEPPGAPTPGGPHICGPSTLPERTSR